MGIVLLFFAAYKFGSAQNVGRTIPYFIVPVEELHHKNGGYPVLQVYVGHIQVVRIVT